MQKKIAAAEALASAPSSLESKVATLEMKIIEAKTAAMDGEQEKEKLQGRLDEMQSELHRSLALMREVCAIVCGWLSSWMLMSEILPTGLETNLQAVVEESQCENNEILQCHNSITHSMK